MILWAQFDGLLSLTTVIWIVTARYLPDGPYLDLTYLWIPEELDRATRRFRASSKRAGEGELSYIPFANPSACSDPTQEGISGDDSTA